MQIKIVSWNVAGIRACVKKGLTNFIKREDADIFCFQEVKAQKDQIPEEINNLNRYTQFHSISKKRGISGVSVYTKICPIRVIEGLSNPLFDDEGRVLTLEFDNFFLINAYFPHSNRKLTRLNFKMNFNSALLNFCKRLKKIKPIIIAGDFNVANKEIDLANPKQNKKNAGFTNEERDWFEKLLKEGFIDTFREFNSSGNNYTWWTYRNNARKRNIGWRIDYFIISKELRNNLKSSDILKEVLGSDHCPILLVLKKPSMIF